jgi:hypothetical protein
MFTMVDRASINFLLGDNFPHVVYMILTYDSLDTTNNYHRLYLQMNHKYITYKSHVREFMCR